MPISQPENQSDQISQQPVFSLEFARNIEDVVAWNNFVISKNINNSNLKLWLRAFLTSLTAVIFVEFLSTNIYKIPLFYWSLRSYIISVIIYIICSYFLLRFQASNLSKKMVKNSLGFLEKTEFDFYEDKLSTKNSNIQVIFNYATFTNLYENQDYLFLAATKTEAIVLPKNFFSD